MAMSPQKYDEARAVILALHFSGSASARVSLLGKLARFTDKSYARSILDKAAEQTRAALADAMEACSELQKTSIAVGEAEQPLSAICSKYLAQEKKLEDLYRSLQDGDPGTELANYFESKKTLLLSGLVEAMNRVIVRFRGKKPIDLNEPAVVKLSDMFNLKFSGLGFGGIPYMAIKGVVDRLEAKSKFLEQLKVGSLTTVDSVFSLCETYGTPSSVESLLVGRL